jgi:hypothetical protein
MVAVADPDSGPADPPVPGRDQLHATSWQQRLSLQRAVLVAAEFAASDNPGVIEPAWRREADRD